MNSKPYEIRFNGRTYPIESIRVYIGQARDNVHAFDVTSGIHCASLIMITELEVGIAKFYEQAAGKEALMTTWCKEMEGEYITYARSLFFKDDWKAAHYLKEWVVNPIAHNAVKYNNLQLLKRSIT